MSKDVFVVRHGDGWGVRTAGARHVAKSFETKAPAFEYGRSMAMAHCLRTASAKYSTPCPSSIGTDETW